MTKYALSKKKLKEVWSSEDEFIGLRFGNKTHYAVIDIDAGSPYQNIAKINEIRQTFEQDWVSVKIYRSSSISYGIHIVLWFERPVDSIGLGNYVEDRLKKAGCTMGYGVLEVYPHQETINKGVRLPFQKGFVELDAKFRPIHKGFKAEKQYDRLLKSIDSSGNLMVFNEEYFESWTNTSFYTISRPPGEHEFKETIENRFLDEYEAVKSIDSSEVTSNFEEENNNSYLYTISRHPRNGNSSSIFKSTLSLIEQGLDGSIKRHEALKLINQYLWSCGYQENNDDYRRGFLRNWIETKHNDFSHDWTHNRKLVYADIDAMVRWRKETRKSTKPSLKGSWGINNHQKAVEKCKNIIKVLLTEENIEPSSITGNKLRKKGMSSDFVTGKQELIRELVDQVLSEM